MAEAQSFVTPSGAGQLVAVMAAVVPAKTEPEDGGALGCSCGGVCSGVVAACVDGEEGHDGCGCVVCECEQLGVVYRFNISARVIHLRVLGSPAVPVNEDTARDGCWCVGMEKKVKNKSSRFENECAWS